MWRRAVLVAALVSYLICVLIMSGMQKEDLDVSMLRKLQRYNVNIDDINNERIRQQCFSGNNVTSVIQKNKINDDYVIWTTTQNDLRLTTENPIPVPIDINTVLNYLKAQQISMNNFSITSTVRTTSVPQDLPTSTAEHIDNQQKIDMNLLLRYIQLEPEKKFQHKLDGNTESFKLDRTIQLKTNERYPVVAEDVAFVGNLFKDYLFQKQILTTTTEHTTRFDIDIQNIYKQIDEIISNGSNTENKSVKRFSDKTEQNNNLLYSSLTPNAQNQNESHLARNRLLKSFYNFINEMNQFKNKSGQLFSSNNVDAKVEPFLRKYQETLKETTTYKSEPKIEPKRMALSPILVKEIAETVKDVIIKDLRNELSDIYIKTTQRTTNTIPTTSMTTTKITTTEKPLNTTSKIKAHEGDTSIMDKVIELYDQIKLLKHATFLMKPNNESETIVNELKQDIRYPAQNGELLPFVNRFQIPETKVLISSIGKYNTKQYFNQDPYLPIKEKNRARPITIQTNSVEIQPLAVPIGKPQSLIRQNIIVDPGYRFQSKENHRSKHITVVRGNRYSDIRKTPRNRTYKYTPMKHFDGYNSAGYPLYVSSQEAKRREDIIRFRMRDNGNSRFDTDYYEKVNFENDRDGPNKKLEPLRDHNIPRFHERLEKMDAGSDVIPYVYSKEKTGRQEQGNADVTSRQQLSLIDMKRGSSYNDSHFKNFLKTQQKVTDILERILATRPKTNTPRSVETV